MRAAELGESLEFTCDQDLADDRTPVQEKPTEFEEPVDGAEVRKHEHAIKEDVDEADPKETQFVFTPEEQAEYNCDEDGNCEDGYDQLCHCGWCGEVFPTNEMRHEVDFG